MHMIAVTRTHFNAALTLAQPPIRVAGSYGSPEWLDGSGRTVAACGPGGEYLIASELFKQLKGAGMTGHVHAERMIEYGQDSLKAAEALRVGHVAHPESVDQALLRAYRHLEERYAAVPAIGTEDIFGGTQTTDTWGDQVRDLNNALVRIRFIARTLGVNSLADE